MKTKIKANTTSKYSTHLLRGYELVEGTGSEYQMLSENWPYPTYHKIGTPKDPYYAEVWVNGMDWQHNYWLIESYKYENPQIYPLIQFTSHDEEDKFNQFNFEELMDAILNYRRNAIWLKSEDLTKDRYDDTVWSFLHRVIKKDTHRHKFFMWCKFEHASQREVKFWINQNFIPLYAYKIRDKNQSVMRTLFGERGIQ